MRRLLPLLLAWATLPAATCGWRGDGTGVFPEADPPVEWSETKNIAWKTPLPNWGNGSPVVGGKNVYVLCEPTEAMPAPILVALDQQTGEELWRAPVDHFDAPGGDQAVQREWHALERRGWAIMRSLLEYRAAVAAGDAAELERLQGVGKELGVTFQEAKGRKGNSVKADFDQRALRPTIARMAAHGIRPLKWEVDILNPKSISAPKPRDHTWCANWAGQTFCAPVADDDHVYVVTGRNAAACFSHDGTRRWLTWLEPRREELDACNEDHMWGNGPFLAGDRLIVYSGRAVYAVAKDTGKLLWTFHLPLKLDGVDGRSFTTIVPVTVDGTVHGCLVLDKLYLFDLATGKDLLAGKRWAKLGRAHSPGVLGPAIVTNRSEDDDGLVCLRFVRRGDGVGAEKLWSKPKQHTRNSPTGFDGRFSTSCGTFDLAGRQVAKGGTGTSRITAALAGGRFYLVGAERDRGFTCTVVEAATGRRLAANRLELAEPTGDHLARVRAHAGDDRWYYFTMAVPLPHGKALFLRSMDHLYCIRP